MRGMRDGEFAATIRRTAVRARDAARISAIRDASDPARRGLPTNARLVLCSSKRGFTNSATTSPLSGNVSADAHGSAGSSGVPLLEQLDADAVRGLHERHLPVPGRPVDRDPFACRDSQSA